MSDDNATAADPAETQQADTSPSNDDETGNETNETAPITAATSSKITSKTTTTSSPGNSTSASHSPPASPPSRKRQKRDSSSNISEDEHEEPPSFSLATLGLQRVGTVQPPRPPKPPQPVLQLNARGMPARIRKKNRFFFDDDIINDDKPLRMSLSPRKTPSKPATAASTATTPTSNSRHPMQSPASRTTPSKVLRHRKGVASRYMRSNEKRHVGPPELRTPVKHRQSSGESQTTPKSSSRSSATGGSTLSARRKKLELEEDECPTVAMDKNIGHHIGLKLRNLLKLPKAHKWVIFEWFYSFIDKPLFEGPNEFQLALMESCRRLRTRKLSRGEWRCVRNMLGKPRRCSPAFFKEERQDLERRRQKLRFLQTRKSGEVRDLNYVRDLPDMIPLQLPIGTKVTARLRVPQDGVFSGTVGAYDSLTHNYRVIFDRPGIGTYSVPDFEIISENFHEKLPLQSITKDFRPSLQTLYSNQCLRNDNKGSSTAAGGGLSVANAAHPRHVRNVMNMNLNKSDPLLGQEVIDSPFKNPVLERENINGYSAKLLENLVRLKRALAIKRTKLQRLSDMNNEAELKSTQMPMAIAGAKLNSSNDSGDESNTGLQPPQLTEEFQRRYASIVISMEKMNKDMQDYLNDVQALSSELTREPQVQAMLTPSYLREKCREAAEESVRRNNQGVIKNETTLKLIRNLSTLLMVASHLKNDGQAGEVNKVLEGCMEEVRGSLFAGNVDLFKKQIELRLQQIHLSIKEAMQVTPVNCADGEN